MSGSMKMSSVAVLLSLALPALADNRAPRPHDAPPVRPHRKELACKADADCAWLPTLCPKCAPCKPTWLEVGTREAARKIVAQRVAVDCTPPRCAACASSSNWLGLAAICHGGQCGVLQAPPPRPKSKERACKSDKDCDFLPQSRCGCAPCGVTWHEAANRTHVERINEQDRIEKCVPAECAKCRSSTRYVGDQALCVRGQCAIALKPRQSP